jgi:RNA polymerase sigma factor (sigma-70 family)
VAEISWGAFAGADDRLELVRALGDLPPRQRAVLVLRYFDDLTEAEVAATLGCTIGTVKSTHSRALEKMRQRVPNKSPGGLTSCSVRKGER